MRKRTFRHILAAVAAKNALALERKARLASRLAKVYPTRAKRFYQIKSVAISQLFRIPGFEPLVREAELGRGGDTIVAIKYVGVRCLQHILLSHLDEQARHMFPRWAVPTAGSNRT